MENLENFDFITLKAEDTKDGFGYNHEIMSINTENSKFKFISLIGKEIKLVSDCIKSNWISSQGKYINQFELIIPDFKIKHFHAQFCNKYQMRCNGISLF